MILIRTLKRKLMKMFRELLVYHHNSLEYRAKVLTLMISSNGEMCECEQEKLDAIAKNIYGNDLDRVELLIDTVNEYHNKIITNNGLNFEHLIVLVSRETKSVKRFAQKIDMESLLELHSCMKSEEDILFQKRILEFLQDLKDEYGQDVRK